MSEFKADPFNHQKYIKQCFQLALKAQGLTSPNPLVGCVIVKDHQVIAKGYHHFYGGDHAEIDALKKINFKAYNATLYCNLEPCFHTGNTGPCVKKIIESGIKKVVIANLDPNPKVNGKSVRLLKESGIEVVEKVLEKEGEKLNRFFFYHIKNKKPYWIVKIASSLDGKISTSNKLQTWLTHSKTGQFVHQLRREVDAILIGWKTLEVDQAKLSVRLVKTKKQPYRLILDSKLNSKINHPIFKTNGGEIIFFTTISGYQKKTKVKLLEQKKAKVILVKTNAKKKIDLKDLEKKLFILGINSVLVEGGGEIFSSFIKEKLPHQLIWIQTPHLLGNKAYPALPGLKSNSFQQEYNLDQMKKLDQDMIYQFNRR